MSFGENLQFLRKKQNITQEQLAESLNVSRQSVSKWESDTSYPEMDKLLLLCEMFSCDMDTLMRGNAEKSVVEDLTHYDAHMNDRSKWIAAGVALILFGVGLVPILESLFHIAEEFSAVAFLCTVAAAVAIFIIKGMQHESFLKRNPNSRYIYSEKDIESFEKRYPLFVAIPVVIILLAVTSTILTESWVVRAGLSEDLAGGIFMWLLAPAVGFLVYGGLQKEKYSLAAKDKTEGSLTEESQEKIKKWCGVIMLIATAIFLLSIGLTSREYLAAKEAGLDFNWKDSLVGMSWIVFPIGGLCCGIASIIFSKTKKDTQE